MNVFQILLTDDGRSSTGSDAMDHAIASVKRVYPQADYALYTNDRLRAFIKGNFEPDVLWAFDRLVPYAYRSDLGRYCLLHALGGWYFDLSVEVRLQLNVGKLDLVAFRDRTRHCQSSYACQNAVIYARQRHPALEQAIRAVVRNCRDDYYGVTPLCPTGPNVLGQALASCLPTRRHVFGEFLELTPQYKVQNLAFVLPDGAILGLYKVNPRGGDLSHVPTRLKGGNSYAELWFARKVYAGPPLAQVPTPGSS